MMKMSFRKLIVWQKAMELARDIHDMTKTFPSDERFGLISQMRDAAVSIPSNIAEGSQRTTEKDFANFLLIAKGSLAEIETQTLLAHSFHYMNDAQRDRLLTRCDEVGKMIYILRTKLKAEN
ncbi:MAG: four helix bundle protein [Patescibacteria group bacterium]